METKMKVEGHVRRSPVDDGRDKVRQWFSESAVESVPIRDVVKWTQGKHASRLYLPPIQRSAVWKNEQIINYWDSLLRGYPAGLMMVHRSTTNGAKGRTTDGQTVEASAQDYHLFDGQQRLTTILLGLGEGQLHDRLKLWVDFGAANEEGSDLLFQLRVSSTGQPFGYQPHAPNQKPPLRKRRDRVQSWLEERKIDRFDSQQAFNEAAGSDLIDSSQAIPLNWILTVLEAEGVARAASVLAHELQNVPQANIEALVGALQRALEQPILFQLIDERVVEDEREYIRFFGRLGQGGTALSNDELTYSIIKHKYPEIHDRIREISEGAAGRLASNVNLVLAALRLAKVQAPWEGALSWEVVRRPNPDFVTRLEEHPEVEATFRTLIPSSSGGRLKELLEQLRDRLIYDPTDRPTGLPTMLLARLPHQLVDVLLLMANQQERSEATPSNDDLLAPFALYWLLFVSHDDKAADRAFTRYTEAKPLVDAWALRELVEEFEQEGLARALPRRDQLPDVRAAIQRGDHHLRDWWERFHELDDDEPRSADALRHLSTNRALIQRALLWFQREYLAQHFPGYDPTSNRDEDLPIDLDHLIPHAKFAFDWRRRHSLLAFEDEDENFRWQRNVVGNSLGNFRWLDAAENRGRGARPIEALANDGYGIRHPEKWNHLIEAPSWSQDEVANFQKLIDLRTLDLYETLLVHAQLEVLVPRTAAARGPEKLGIQ